VSVKTCGFFFGKLKLFVIDNVNQREGARLSMIKITKDDLLQDPETIRPTPLGRLTTIFDVIISDSISNFDEFDVVVYNKSHYKIENVDSDTIMPSEYVRFYCSEIKEFDKAHKTTGGIFYH
jgi:hypothetical protein